MKRIYESPELEISKFTFSESVLGISEGEIIATGGVIEEPDPDMELQE